MKNIESILSPQCVAVVGATNRPGSVGRAVMHNILNGGYKGIVFPVNPSARAVLGVKAYPGLKEIPDEVDMAVIIVPALKVSEVVDEAAAKGIKGLIVITAGFKEIAGKGAVLESQLKEQVKKYGIGVVGPNCLGVMNTHPDVCLNASFAPQIAKQGSIAFISQSGAVCTAVLDFAAGRNIGFSKFVSFGNKVDVDEIDLLLYLKDDPETKVICMYLEDISSGLKFIEVVREITWEAKKPIFAIKSGRSAEGARAAASHTGSLAGSDAAYDAIFLQSGVQRVDGIEELFNHAVAFARQPVPKGNRIAIVTNAGGPGIMATDTAIRHGLALAKLSPKTRQKLEDELPETANINNPVDVIGDANPVRYEIAIKSVLEDEGVDGAIVILTPQAMTDILKTAQIVPEVCKGIDKPVLTCFMGIVDVSAGVRYLEDHGFPNYAFPEDAARSMAAMARFGKLLGFRRRHIHTFEVEIEKAREIVQEKLKNTNRCYLSQYEANEILKCYGFPVVKNRLITGPSQIEDAVKEIGLPVAMKIVSPDIIHKFDAGGVVLNVNSLVDAEKAYRQITENAIKYKDDAYIKGVLMEKMAAKGVEVILGATRDPRFGPICMFGLGGTFVEALTDVTFRLAPMWEVSAEIMIGTIKGFKVLQGVRGMPPSDVGAIKDCVLRLSQMVTEIPEISELDINPLIVLPAGQGCVVADSRMVLVSK